MAVHYLDDGNDDGTCLGQAATSKVGFFGATPIVQVAVTAVATTNTTTAVYNKVDRLYTAIVNLGLINTGG